MQYSVRIGKKHPTVYVRTPKGSILRFARRDLSREQAKRLAQRIRGQLKRGGKLNSAHWQVILRVGGGTRYFSRSEEDNVGTILDAYPDCTQH